MVLGQTLLITLAVALAMGILLGVKIAAFFSKLLYGSLRNRYYSPAVTWNNPEPSHYRGHKGEISSFGSFTWFFVGLLLLAVGKSAYTQIKMENWDYAGEKTSKNLMTMSGHMDNSINSPEKSGASVGMGSKAASSRLKPSNQESTALSQPTKNPQKKKFIVKVGSFKYLDSAERKVKELQSWGIQAQYVVENLDVHEIYTVYAGPYSTKSGAEAVKQEIKSHKAMVMP